MQINLPAATLKVLIKAFSKVVTGRGTLPVLSCLRFRHDPAEDVTTVEGTNLDETLIYHLPPESVAPGGADAFLVPFQEFRNLAVNLSSRGSVLLTPEGDSAVIAGTRCGDSLVQREFGSMPASEFPSTMHPLACAPADVASFLQGYHTVLTAASPDETRAVLHGVFYDHQNSCMAATDSRRLMLMPVTQLPIGGDLIVPQSKVLANGILDGVTGGTMGIHVKEGGGRPLLELNAGVWTYRAQCIEGHYPNYRQVIPGETSPWQGEFRFDPEDLQLLRLTVRQYTDADHGAIGLVTDGTRLMLIRSSVNSDGKPPYVELPHSRADVKAPVLIGVNAEFFMEGITAGCLRVRIIDPYTPLRCENAGNGALYVLMPLREIDTQVTRFVDETFKVPAPATVSTTQEETDMARKPQPNEPAQAQVTAPVVEAKPEDTAQTVPVTVAAAVAADVPFGPTEAGSTPGTVANPTAETGTPADGKTGLQLLPPENPEEALIEGIQVLQEKLNDLQNDLRMLRQKARAVEKHYRTRSKDIESKAQLITKFQKAVGF